MSVVRDREKWRGAVKKGNESRDIKRRTFLD